MLILGYSALYLVEAKGHTGRFTGDSIDWRREYEGGHHYMESPYRQTNSKAKILAGHLKSKLADRKNSPFVQPLIFLSHESAELHFDPGGDTAVVTRKNFLRAIQYGEVPGVAAPSQVRPISKPAAADITQALAKLGFRESKGRAQVGSYELGAVIADGPGYQDRGAQHRNQKHLRRRARIYLVPSQTTTERRAQLRRAAERESVLLHDIRDHRGVLSINDYVADAPLGPTVMFDDFEGGTPLDAFIRQHRKLTLAERVDLITQVGRALAHCHDKGIIHGGLSPDAVLARQNADGSLETRLYNLQLGYGEDTGATSHWTALASSSWMIYQAPEFLQNSHNRTVVADVFALGALAYFILTGVAPAIDLVEATKTLAARQCFDPLVATDRVPDNVAEVVALATQVSFAARADNVTEWVELLNSEARPPESASPVDATPPTDPLSCEKDDTLHGASGDLYGVVSILGHGASARGILVNRVTPEGDERQLVLKVSLSPEHDTALAGEGDVLENLRHSQIVTLLGRDTIADRPCLLLSRAGQDNLHDELAFLGALSLDFASKLDIPKERFISYPGCESDEDGEPVYGWAGWDHLQRAQALATLYQKRKTEEAWPTERLIPMLAGLYELLPWLKQWHNEKPDPVYGEKMGDFYERFIEGERNAHGLSKDDITSWRPPAKSKPKAKKKPATKKAKTPERPSGSSTE